MEETVEEMEDQTPDLDILEDLESEMEEGSKGNIFAKLVQERMEILSRLHLLSSLVNDKLILENGIEGEMDLGNHGKIYLSLGSSAFIFYNGYLIILLS